MSNELRDAQALIAKDKKKQALAAKKAAEKVRRESLTPQQLTIE